MHHQWQLGPSPINTNSLTERPKYGHELRMAKPHMVNVG